LKFSGHTIIHRHHGAWWCDRITHVLRQLHWLPVRRRVDYNVTCLVMESYIIVLLHRGLHGLVHRSLSGLTPG